MSNVVEQQGAPEGYLAVRLARGASDVDADRAAQAQDKQTSKVKQKRHKPRFSIFRR